MCQNLRVLQVRWTWVPSQQADGSGAAAIGLAAEFVGMGQVACPKITLSSPSKGLSLAGGSRANTSMPAPAIRPLRNASIRAAASTTSPRPVLISTA